MYKKHSVLVIIPARGGSSRLPGKNIKKLKGKPLIAYAISAARASKYADRFNFDALNLETYHPQQYIEAIKAAGEAGYDVLIIDSLSHAWAGKDGSLELVDRAAAKSSWPSIPQERARQSKQPGRFRSS